MTVATMNAATMTAPAAAELLTYGQTATLLGLCERTVARLAKSDASFPPKVLIGKRVRFRRGDLLRWIADQPAA